MYYQILIKFIIFWKKWNYIIQFNMNKRHLNIFDIYKKYNIKNVEPNKKKLYFKNIKNIKKLKYNIKNKLKLKKYKN